MFGAAQAAIAQERGDLPGGRHPRAQPPGPEESIGGDVVVVSIEGAPGDAEQFGEGVQLGEGDVTDQV